MTTKYLIPCLMFMMKYFFDIEKEITQQMITTVSLRIHDCKELITNLAMLHK